MGVYSVVVRDNQPFKVGYLKEDLYQYNADRLYVSQTPAIALKDFCNEPFSFDDKEQAIKEALDSLDNLFQVAMKKGRKFYCFRLTNCLFWFDEYYTIGYMSEDWAVKHLENIEEL